MDDLLHLVHSDGADGLRLRVGEPPIIVLDGESESFEGPAMTAEEVECLLQSISDTRQRRDLRAHGQVEFLYRFRDRVSFVVHVKLEDQNVSLDIH